MREMSPIAVLGENGEWAEISVAEAARLVADGTLYFCGGDGRPDVACHVEDVYHVSPGLSDVEQAALLERLRKEASER